MTRERMASRRRTSRSPLTAFLSLIIACAIFLVPTQAKADLGPKPSVDLTIVGLTEKSYVTLLSAEAQLGPWDAQNPDDDSLPKEVQAAFRSYKAPEGFYYLGCVAEYDDSYQWVRYPPETFRVLIYQPKSDRFMVGEPIEKQSYLASYRIVVDDGAIVSQVSAQDYAAESLRLAIRVALTVIIELVVGLAMGLRSKRDMIIVGATNVVTQLILNGCIWIFSMAMGSLDYAIALLMLPLLLAEPVVFIIEALIYRATVKDLKHPILYALLANTASFAAGLFL